MEVNRKRISLTFLLINLLVIGVSIIFYYVFMTSFTKKFTSDYVAAFQPVVQEKSNEQINGLVELFGEYTDAYNLTELNNLIGTASELDEVGFLSFILKSSNLFTYDGIEVNIDNSYLQDYGFGFFENYAYFFNDQVIGILDFGIVFNIISNATNATDVFLMSNTGEIYHNSNSVLYKNVLHEYLNVNTDEYFDNYFSLKKDAIIFSKIGGEAVIVNFSPLEDFDNLYIAQQFYEKDIEMQYLSIGMFFAFLFIVMAILNALILLYLFYYVNKKNADIESKKIKYYYAKPYIFKVNRRGRITGKNQRATKEIMALNGVKNIEELFTDEDGVVDKMKRGVAISLNINERNVAFIPVKYSKGYYLIGEFIEGEEGADLGVYKLAYFDPITDLANIHLFKKHVNDMLSGFKPIDDKLVHFIGIEFDEFRNNITQFNKIMLDVAIKEIAKELSAATASAKMTTSYNTDIGQFILLVKEGSFKDVEALTLRILKHFESPLTLSEGRIKLNAYAGILPVYSKQSRDLTPEIILSQVDETLKRASQSQTQKYFLFDDTITKVLTEKQILEQDLEKGIQNKEFIPYLQAQYHHVEDRIIGFESLMRWNHPNYINKSPLAFIQLAEENGMIYDISKIMMEKTFEAAKELENYNVNISINISPIEMLRQGFTEDFLEAYRRYKLKPGRITVEITETALLHSFNTVNEKIKILKRNGINIDLDDFGTGYSSLHYIKELNFDAIKIDKMFVDYIETDVYNKAIVQMIINLAKTLKASVIAEGVESESQMNYLVRNGCNIIQGYFISRPVPLADAKQLLEDYNVKKTKSFKKKGGK